MFKFKRVDKKKVHKFLIWAVIGSTIVGFGVFSKTKKWKSWLKKVFYFKDFFKLGIKELIKFLTKRGWRK